MAEDEKPKSLADLELEQKTEEVEGSDDSEHEHEHSDQLTYKEDPAKLKLAHGTLIAMSVGGLAIVIGVALYLIFTFEGRNPITDPVEVSIHESSSLIPLPGQIFYSNDGRTPEANFVIATDPSTSHQYTPKAPGNLEPSNASRNPNFQVSRNGNTIAYQLKGAREIVVEDAVDSFTAFSGDNASSIEDWLLVPDGSRIIALVKKAGKTQLLDFSVNSKTSKVGDASFSISGASSPLHHSNDGSIKQFAFSGPDQLSILEYSLSEGEKDPRTIDSPRLPDNPRITSHGLSPDGTHYIYQFESDGEDRLGMVSLNSQTVRTIYEATTPAASIVNLAWAPDARTLLISESQNGAIKRLIKLDTGPLTVETVVDDKTEGLNASGDIAINPVWSDDNGNLAFFNGGTIWLFNLENKALSQLLSNQPEPSNQVIYGWYSRNAQQ